MVILRTLIVCSCKVLLMLQGLLGTRWTGIVPWVVWGYHLNGFSRTINYFKFLNFKKNLKVQLSAVGKMYIACTLHHNARCCLYGSTTSKYFEVPTTKTARILFVNRWHSCIIAASSVDKLHCFNLLLLSIWFIVLHFNKTKLPFESLPLHLVFKVTK